MFPIDWRQAWRLWSVRVSALGSIFFAALALIPDQLMTLWNLMPAEIRGHIPERAAGWIGLLLFVLVIVVRLVPQKAIAASLARSKDGRVSPRVAGLGAVGGMVALALSLSVADLKADEGKRNVGYLDIAGVPTECYGHTGPEVKVGAYKTDAQCEVLLRQDAMEHLQGALACSPELALRPYQLAAVTRLTFNIGVGGYCRSSIQRHFAVGRWREGCDRFLAYRYAGGREIRGLVLRRQRERAQCLQGLSA